ncbi:CDP-glycerol glycerophosphotransferase family protein [Glutamicibacter sp. MNS18]|uniref:CDP-glycerol glycerophosphotransferase family protein n=1 Tax=Glutamicibacter sp. MNS18 TaxID=2989817 RepID=UPI0022358DF9|nr:CDP-glycerol glycerophosphotransferase family protein [Glutamicibacter sp. MNS18]MCW4466168.1 CDP-glycerol glycerophosphotransferase family protein [Glutamicibacter sp. MNS18]
MTNPLTVIAKQSAQLDATLLRARVHGKRAEWDQVISLLEKTMPNSLDNPERCYYLSNAFFNLKKFDKAIPYAERAVELNSSNTQWLYRLASLYSRTGRHQHAARVYESLIEKSPAEARWQFLLGKSLLASKEPSRGLEAIRQAAVLEPLNREYVNFLAAQFRSRKIFWEEALLLEKSEPQTATEKLGFGRALAKMNRHENAAPLLAYAADHLLKDQNAAYEAGLAYETIHDGIRSDRYYELAINRDPNAKRFGIGRFHEKYGNWHLAAKAYEAETKLRPWDGELHYRAGLANDRLFKWAAAERHYRYAVLCSPMTARWHYKLGLSLERQKRWGEAAQVYAYAAKAFNNSYWWYRAGLALHEAGHFEEAYVAFKNSVARFEEFENDLEVGSKQVDEAYLRALLTSKISIPLSNRCQWFVDRARLWISVGGVREAINCLELAVLATTKHDPSLYVMLAIARATDSNWHGASDALRNIRIFKWQDGINVEERTKNSNVRNIAEYAEYFEDLEIDPNLILWQSNGGESIGCHPLALFEELSSRDTVGEYKHVWVLNDENTDIPIIVRDSTNVVFVKRHSESYRRVLSSAKYLVNNSTFPGYFIRKDGQQYLNTWHGTPYKTLGKDMRGEMFKHAAFVRDILQSTHLISPNSHTTKVLIDSHDVRGLFTGKLAELGSPRVDKTLNLDDSRRHEIRRMLGITDDRPIVLYAPTWRGTSNTAEVDANLLLSHIAELSEIDANLVFRAHRLEEQALRGIDLQATVAPSSIDTNELLSVIDILVTDYSSIYFDFMPRLKPIIFFMYDQEEYIEQRGLYFKNSELPGPIAATAIDVKEQVNLLIEKEFKPDDVYLQCLNTFCPEEDGESASRVLDFWLRDETPRGLIETTDDLETLVFQQSMIPTGMSASFLNLVNALDPQRYRIVLLVEPRLILSELGRQETISRLPQHVQIIGRSGGRVMSPEDLWIAQTIDDSNEVLSEELWIEYMKSFEREARRIFGSAKVSASIQFDGYVPFWNGISAAVGDKDSTARIIYLHNDMYEEWCKRWPNLSLTFQMYNSYDSLISVSETMRNVNRDNLTTAFEAEYSKFDYCENMIDFEDIRQRSTEPLDPEYAHLFDGTRTIFMTSGRLSIEKDQQKLIRAFAEYRKNNANAHLVLLGDGPLKAELQSLTSELKIEHSVTFTGRVANPYPMVNASDCFVLPSNHEGQPMVLLEAMVLGKKIFATNIPGSAHVLGNEYGLIVENSADGLLGGFQAFDTDQIPTKPFDPEDYAYAALNAFMVHLTKE